MISARTPAPLPDSGLAPAAIPPPAGTSQLRRWLMAWPLPCAVCRRWQAQRVCMDCLIRFAAPRHRCVRCAAPVPAAVRTCGRCVRHPPAFEAAIAALDYAQPWSGLIAELKFKASPGLAAVFAQRLAAALAQAPPTLPQDLLIVPVPLSDARLRERGYNQSWEIARRLAPLLGRRASAGILLRLFDAPHQVGSGRQQRLGNVIDAFAVDPLARPYLQGRPVAVVDDVMTTGATMDAAARTLLRAGACSVHAWTASRAA